MNRYVFLTFAVAEMGGTQMYLRNKMKYLLNLGWKVSIFSCIEGKVYIDDLKSQYNIIKELEINPIYLRKRHRQNIVKQILKVASLSPDDNIIFESNFIQAAYWGELLAKICNAKNFVYLLQETFYVTSKHDLDFFEFKLKRRELYGITDISLCELFRFRRKLEPEERYWMRAYCSNCIDDVASETIKHIEPADYHIGSIGRINKEFVLPMVAQVKEFAVEHPTLKIQLCFLGGSSDKKDENQIMEIVNSCKNLSAYISGFLYPIPRQFVKQMDVFVSSAGSAQATFLEGIPTISIDANDYNPIGILGLNTERTVLRSLDERLSYQTKDLLDLIFNECDFSTKLKEKTETTKTRIQDFNEHLKCLDNSACDKQYYNISKIISSRKMLIAYHFFGYFIMKNILYLL